MFGGRSFDRGPHGFDAAGDLVDNWLARIEERDARSSELAARLAELTATGSSRAGRVSVTVGATGAVTALRLDEAIRDQPADDTAREILAALRAAHLALAAKASAVTAEAVGTESEAGRAALAPYANRVSADT